MSNMRPDFCEVQFLIQAVASERVWQGSGLFGTCSVLSVRIPF